MKLRTLIADDEPLARERLKRLLASDDDIDIVEECRNGREVIVAVNRTAVDLVFLDIEMPGNDGFEVIERIGVENMPTVVFVTAHDSYAVKAFEVRALDYLMKPVEPIRLRTTLRAVKERVQAKSNRSMQTKLQALLDSVNSEAWLPRKYEERLIISNGMRQALVKVHEIDWIEAADYYALIHVGTRTFTLRETVKELACRLDPNRFVRIHRSAIVNVDRVKEILREGHDEHWAILSGGQKVKMSQVGRRMLLNLEAQGERTQK